MKWLEIVELLRQDINAKLSCPNCSSDKIVVLDTPFDDSTPSKGGERHLTCKACNSSNSVLYRTPPSNWMAKRNN